MKKEEKIQEIRKRAHEYAMTGDYDGWISIEFKLRSEGYTLAEQVLEDDLLRNQLDSLCEIAVSPEEVERRNRFKKWLDKTRSHVSPIVKKESPEVLLFVHNKTLFVNGPTYSFEIRRSFASNELEVTRVWEEKDGQRYRSLTPDRVPELNFEEITGERAVELITGFVRSGAAKASGR